MNRGTVTNAQIRIDSPTDIQYLSDSDPLLKNTRFKYPSPTSPFRNSTDFKVEGNTYYAKKDYVVAESIYSQGLRRNPPKNQQILLHLNRSAAHLQLSNFASAGRDAAYVLQSIEESDRPDSEANMKLKEKALFRLASSQYGQRKFLLAKSTGITLLQNFPTSQEAKEGIAKCEAREKESATGEYDFFGMYQSEGGAVRFDVADYQGPIKVERITTRGGERGIFATRDIEVGEVLLVEKAFDVVFAEEGNLEFIVANVDPIRRMMKHKTTIPHVTNVIQKLVDNRSLVPLLDALYAGPKTPGPLPVPLPRVDDPQQEFQPVGIDVKRIDLISEFNESVKSSPLGLR